MSKPSPSVLVIPFPAQGHVNSFLNFSHKLAQHGFNIIFVNSDAIHERVLSSTTAYEQESLSGSQSQIRLVSIPDGLGPEDDRNDIVMFCRSMLSTMPAMLEKLIEDLISSGSEISCVVADTVMGWALEVACKLGIKTAALSTACAAIFALQYHVPKLIHDGVIDSNGFPTRKGTFQLSPSMPPMETDHIFWTSMGNPESQKSFFNFMNRCTPGLDLTEWWFCNTTYELEPRTLTYMPKLQPIGPLLEGHHTKKSLGQFWKEDLSCLSWLDQQPPGSVIYLAFGSTTNFDSRQYQAIALGLELTNRPFLWVVRPDFTSNSGTIKAYPQELKGKLGKIVGWAPQWHVLSHPSIACFISHCGWNSVMDGLCNGVPFLCWPYFADQPYNKACICDEWKVGLGLDSDENGFVSSGEIKKKVDQLLGDGDLKASSLKLKEVLMNNIAQGGQSQERFLKFANWLKE